MHDKSTVAHWDYAWQQRTSLPIDYHGFIVSKLVRHLGALKNKRILEVGAGSAKDSARLAELGAKAFAIDYSSAAVGLAKEVGLVRSVKLLLSQANTFQLPFEDGTFDAVFSQGLLEHFTNPQAALKEQTRVVKSGGIIIVDVPQMYNLYSLYKWYRMRRGSWFAGWETSFSLRQLESLFHNCGLVVIDSYGDGYYPGILLALRNVHTFGRRHSIPLGLPDKVVEKTELFWRHLEEKRAYYRWLWNIGVLGKKP